MAKHLVASILLLLICLLRSTMNTRTRAASSESELVGKFKLVTANSEPITPTIIHNHGHKSEQAREAPKALSVPQSPENPALLGCEGETTWCIAKPSTGDERLNANIEFCCQQPAIDCKLIQPGGKCYNPDNGFSHASVVMNLYYKANNKQPHNCDFVQSGLIITQDPSVGECIYEA